MGGIITLTPSLATKIVVERLLILLIIQLNLIYSPQKYTLGSAYNKVVGKYIMETFTIVGSGRIIETLFEEYIGEKKHQI